MPVAYTNKRRCLVVCSRGVTARYRHLLEDLRTLMPHHKKESKLDATNLGAAVADICELRGCDSALLLECRKRGQDAYLWLGRPQMGPSVKFHLSNVHTMDELRLTGNCVKGSRPLLQFDESFGRLGHLKLIKELLWQVFNTPEGHPKSKPFVDRIMCFYYADKRIWVRNYQILDEDEKTDETQKLVEIGPRFVLNPIRIFRGSHFAGQTLYQNNDFVSPNAIRAQQKRAAGEVYNDRKEQQAQRKRHKSSIHVPEDPLDRVFK